MHESSKCSETTIVLCLFCDWRLRCCTSNAKRVTTQTPNTAQQQPCQYQDQSSMKVIRFDSRRGQTPNDPFPFEIFRSPSPQPCRLRCVLVRESKLSWIICGLEWYEGRRRPAQMLVFSSVVSSLCRGYGSIRAAIYVRCLGCLFIEKKRG